jgi:hypothetical protein
MFLDLPVTEGILLGVIEVLKEEELHQGWWCTSFIFGWFYFSSDGSDAGNACLLGIIACLV